MEKIKMIKKLLNPIVILFVTLTPVFAQEFKVYSNSEDMVMIDECLGMVNDQDGKVKITSLNSKTSGP